jgi:8-oxo-dGTP pyrophosphatase MutT (NUDIX family)
MMQAVVAVILRDGRFLAIQRGPAVPYSGWWAPPSGRIEPGETQAEAVAREVAEELGLDVEPLAKVWECPTDDGRYTLHWWTAHPRTTDLELHPGEVSAARWVTPAEYLALEPAFAGDREFAASVLPGLMDAAAGPTRRGR